jgi:hypothetical protein
LSRLLSYRTPCHDGNKLGRAVARFMMEYSMRPEIRGRQRLNMHRGLIGAINLYIAAE